MTIRSDAVTNYLLAKDGNRPWLMRRAFTSDARLEMVVRTEAISFPSTADGVDEITETLVRRFSEDQENVYTFCLSDPPDQTGDSFSCAWLVGMSRRDNGDVRVGCGRYDWSFAGPDHLLARKLAITIEVMEILPPERLGSVMTWLDSLPYPWCSAQKAAEAAPEGLGAIEGFLREIQPQPVEGGAIANQTRR